MVNEGEIPNGNEREQSLEQQVLDVFIASHNVLVAHTANMQEYINAQNDFIKLLLDGKRITATAIPNAPRRAIGYHNKAFRWVPRDDQNVTSISGLFSHADVRSGRLNLIPDDPTEECQYWDVTLVNNANKSTTELVAEIKVEE